VVHTYDVLGTPTNVGAEFHVEYIPQGTDPTSNIHWIQVVTNNHPDPGVHDNMANEVDTRSLNGSPYYDDGFTATNREFYDFSQSEALGSRLVFIHIADDLTDSNLRSPEKVNYWTSRPLTS
jgi:hypothetical protein